MKVRFRYIIIFVFLWSCNYFKDNACQYTIEKLKTEYQYRIFSVGETNGFINEYRDKGVDSLEAGYYEFYKNGNLKEYLFFKNLKSYRYSEKYYENGELKNVTGQPYQTKYIELDSNAYLSIRFHFFALNKEYKDFKIKDINGKEYGMVLREDTLFTNSKIAEFGTSCKGLKERKLNFTFSIEYKNKCNGKVDIIRDTFIKYFNCNSCKIDTKLIDTSIVLFPHWSSF
jgi:hypothetical protein